MIDKCVTLLKDYFFETTNLKSMSEFSYNLLEKVYDNNASIQANIKERCPKFDNSLKVSLSFFHFVYCVNVEYTVRNWLIRKGVKRTLFMVERLLRVGLISSARSCSV